MPIPAYMWLKDDGGAIGGSGLSLGCITLQSRSQFQTLRQALLQTTTIPARHSGLHAYGWIEVVTHGNTCPQDFQDSFVLWIVFFVREIRSHLPDSDDTDSTAAVDCHFGKIRSRRL
ncbi:protein of unknown function [Burkholderia multivorans]